MEFTFYLPFLSAHASYPHTVSPLLGLSTRKIGNGWILQIHVAMQKKDNPPPNPLKNLVSIPTDGCVYVSSVSEINIYFSMLLIGKSTIIFVL